MLIAQKAVRMIEQATADLVASDCPLAGLQLDQAGAMAHAGGRPTKHPIQIVRDAYGLGHESGDPVPRPPTLRPRRMRQREQFRSQIIALKQRRRISVGPLITLVFENRETLRFQTQK
jgi:hypothetical protein